MVETDSVRLARIEEKFDALADKLDERHAQITKDMGKAQKDICDLKDDRAKAVGGALVVGAIMGAIGGAAMKLWPFGH